MLSARFYPDGHGFWVLYCLEWNLELSLIADDDLVEAANAIDQQPCSCGFINCCHKPKKQVDEAIALLKINDRREFNLPWDSPLADRILESL